MKNKRKLKKNGVLVNTSNLQIMPNSTRINDIAVENTTLVINQLSQKALLFKPIISKLCKLYKLNILFLI
jgi:hypothetical protein